MARSIVSLTKDLWTDLGAAPMVVTIHKEGDQGSHLKLNTTNADAPSLIVSKGRMGHQFSNNDSSENMWAKATGENWQVAVDV